MNGIRIALIPVLALFSAASLWVVVQHGYLGFFELALANGATRLLSLDLVISLSLVCAWMITDARSRGARWLPYAVLTLALGSAGPLLYLINRPQSA